MKKKYLLPVVASVFALCVVTLMTFPMLKSAPRDIPIAAVVQDEGVKTPTGTVYVGQSMLDGLKEKTSGDDGIFAWTTFVSEKEMQASMNDFYATIVIPKDFTLSQMAAKVDPTKTPTSIQLTINQGKNPTVASATQAVFTGASLASGVKFDTTIVNPIPADMGSGTIAMVFAMILLLPSIITAFIITRFIELETASRKAKSKSILIQLAYAAGLSLVIGMGAAGMVDWLGGANIPFWHAAMFGWIASFAFQTIVLASVAWFKTPGMAIPVGLMILGMTSISLPHEFLPSFWQNFIYPWAPQHFMGEGARQIFFLGDGFLNRSSFWLSITAVVGLAFLFAVLFKKPEKPAKPEKKRKATA
ncbi:SNG1 family protein [Candidatus Saccharibacteria bacterium]|nr:SNG1 family protein [Candidatus Saccharibacteria bacterium]